MQTHNKNRIKWLHLRLSPDEHKILAKKQLDSTCRNLSQYIRNVIFDRPIVATYRNKSQDEATQQLALLNRELNAIGNNLNQITKKLHTSLFSEQEHWAANFTSQAEAILSKIGQIKEVIQNISERWLR